MWRPRILAGMTYVTSGWGPGWVKYTGAIQRGLMWEIIVGAAAIVGTIVAVAAWLDRRSGERLMSKMRNEPTYDWPSVYPEIAKAKNRVLLLQTWFPTLTNELPAWEEALLKGSVDFKVLLADQKLVEHRLRSREPVDSLLMQNVSQIRYMIEDLRGKNYLEAAGAFLQNAPFWSHLCH